MNVRRRAGLFIFDESKRLLLFRIDDQEVFVNPARPHTSPYWILPGGGLEDGETYEQGAVRELREETGLDAPLGPCVGMQDVVLLIRGAPTRCLERYYLVRVDRPVIDVDGLFGVERDLFRGYEWWVSEEMGPSGETFLPPGMVELAGELAAGNVPSTPVELRD